MKVLTNLVKSRAKAMEEQKQTHANQSETLVTQIEMLKTQLTDMSAQVMDMTEKILTQLSNLQAPSPLTIICRGGSHTIE
jgi:hypothetical protein